MPCERPKRIINPRYKGLSASELRAKCNERYSLDLARPPDYEIEVPCGKCASCQKRRLQCFRLRLLYELEQYPNSLFITLSFTDSALEEYKDNYNKAVCQFMDSMRKRYGRQLRHFFVLEYGTENGRPHYHGILFNVPWLDFFEVESIWNRGNGRIRTSDKDFVDFYRKPRGIIYLESIRERNKLASYITKYLTKDYNPDRPCPRVLTSVGLGVSYLTEEVVRYHRSNLDTTITICGYPFVLPEYYKRKIFTEDDRIKIVYNLFCNPKSVWFVDGRQYYSKDSFKQALSDFHDKQVLMGLSFNDRQIFPRNKRCKRSYLIKPNKDFYYVKY